MMKKTPWLLKTYSGDVELITDSIKYDINGLKSFSANTVNDFSFVSSYYDNLYRYITENETNWGNDIDVSNFVTSSTDLSGSYILSSNGSTTTWHELEEEYELSGFNGIIISANSANKTINVGYNGGGTTSEVFYKLSAGQNIGIQSATDGINDYLIISANSNSNVSLPESANWNNVYNTVTNNSANWDEVNEYSAGSNINITNNTISSKDWTPELNTKLNSTAFTLPTSSNWTKAYDTVTANSANWENDIDVSNFITSSTDLSGSYILSSNGQNAVWSQLDENYDLSGFNGIIISANSANKTINVGYNGSEPISEAVYNLSAGQNIGIQSATDGINDYLVISANSITEIDLPESANWNNTYSTVNSESANWNSVSSVTNNTINLSAGQNIGIQSATDGINDYLVISANSNSNVSLPESANWNNTYSTVNSESANWNSVSSVTSNIMNLSAGQNIGIQSATVGDTNYLVISANAITEIDLPESANWNNTYSTVTNNSANWNSVSSVTSNILNLSAGQNIGIQSATDGINDYLIISANANSNVSLPESANWTKVYDTVTANSANWNNDLDTLYSAGPNIDITGNIISSKDWTPELNAKLNSTEFTLPTSSNWTKAYETVTANSANWDEVIQYSAGSNINITNNTISSKDWTPELNAKLNSTDFSNVSGKFVQTLSTSANWTNAYDTVTANSANWNNDLDTLYSAGSNINITNNTISSKDWTPELNTKLNSSAFSNVSGKFVQTLPSSANWDNVYNTVTANSANWYEVVDVSNFVTSSTDLSGSYILSSNGSTTTWHELEEEYELSGLNGVFISANSANKSIDISLTESYDISGFNGILVSANSANKTIDISYSGNLDDLNNNTFTLQAGRNVVLTSGENGDNKYLTISAAGIESIGTPYELSGGENIDITSATDGTKDYLVISAKGGDSLGTPYNLSAGQNIGIQSATDGISNYLVISANSNSNVSLPESANWNNTYSTVNSESANWNSVSSVTSNILNLSAGQNIEIQSATIGDDNYLVISANSNSNVSLPESANWNNTYSTVNSESANWNSVSSVTSNILNLSAGQNIGIQSATDGINDYLIISAIGGGEGATYVAGPNINITNNTISSKDWTPELNAKLNSTAFTLPESANWNNTYGTVNSESANWNSVSSVTSNIINLSAGQNIGIQSATIGDTDYLVISAIGGGEGATYVAGPNINITNNTISSKDWTPELNAKLNSTAFTLPESANWNNTYSTVTNNSADWSGMYSLVAGNSAYWGQGEGTVFELYSSNDTIGISSTTAAGNKIIYDISLEGTTTSRNYFINRQEQTDAAEYLPNTNITLPDLGNGWQIVNGEANYGDIKYTSLSAYSMNGSAYIIPEEVKLASVDIRLDVIIPSGGLSANYQKVEIVIFDDIKNEYIGKYEKWIDISYDRTEQLNFSEIITEPSSVKLYFRSEFACQTYCRTFSLVDLTYKMLLINNNVTGGSVSLPTSANWNNTYSIVTSNSANWNSVSSVTGNIMNLSAGQNIGIQSATDGINDYLVISANAITEIDLPSSANWNNTYSTVTTNSANWNSVSSLSAKSDSILCQNISYTTTGSNINVTVPNNTYATVSGLNVTGTINVIIPATNVINGSELNSCAGRLTFSTNKPSTLNFVDSSITSKLPVIGQLPTTYSGTNYQFTCVAGVVACQEIKTIT